MNPYTNFMAPLLLGTYPLVILGLFMMYRPAKAVLISLIVGELFLPPLYNLPITPSWLSKWTLPPLMAAVFAVFFARGQLRSARMFRGVEGVFLLLLVVNFMTFWTNRDPLRYGPLLIPGASLKDLNSDVVRFFLDPWVVFFLGRALFKTSRDLTLISRLLVTSLLVYSLLILFEIRMSPNLNYWLYGFHAGRFDMTFRWGGFRPVVFFKDGLPLASFVLTGAVTAAAMARLRMRVWRLPMRYVAIYLVFILVICKSTGAIVYALFMLPLVSFASPRRALTVASVSALLFMIYPIVRFTDVVPVKAIVDFFAGISADRAESLLFRFNMEQDMLELTRQRPLWGWGLWGRNLTYDTSGMQQSIPDGAMIITLSTHGVFGFYCYFIPFAYTIFRAAKAIKKIKGRAERLQLSALALNCGIVLLDLIINSAFYPFHMLLFGALYSLPAGIIAEEAAAQEAAFTEDGTEDGAAADQFW